MKSTLLAIMALMVNTQIFAQSEVQKVDRIHGQMYYGKLSTNAFFKQADYIFEATLLSRKQESIPNSDTTQIKTSSLFEISHVFKGGDEIHTGLIELVRDCGIIYKHGDPELYYRQQTSKGQLADNPVFLDYKTEECLGMRKKMVLFCKKAPDSYQKTDNTFAIQPLENLPYAAFIYGDDSPNVSFRVYGLDHVYFKTVEDFYKFAAKKKGITVPGQETSKKKRLCALVLPMNLAIQSWISLWPVSNHPITINLIRILPFPVRKVDLA